MEPTEQKPKTRAELEEEIAYRNNAIIEKRRGRDAMQASGMTLESEEDDMDMREHLDALERAQSEISVIQTQEDDARIAAAAQSPLL